MIRVVEKILKYLYVYVVMAMLNVDLNRTNIKQIPVNYSDPIYFRESARLIISYLDSYKIADPEVKDSARIFMESVKLDKSIQGNVAKIVARFFDLFNSAWLDEFLAELNSKNNCTTPGEYDDYFHVEDCYEDENVVKCGVNPPNKEAIAETEGIKTEEHEDPVFANKSSQNYSSDDTVYRLFDKEKNETNKIYRQSIEDVYQEVADTGDMAYQNLNILDEDSSDAQENRKLEGNGQDDAQPLNLMLFSNTQATMDQNAYGEDTATAPSDQGSIENEKILNEPSKPSKEEFINNEHNALNNQSGNVINAETQQNNNPEMSRDDSDEITNHVIHHNEEEEDEYEENEDPQSNDKEAYIYETYEEDYDENHASARKLLEFNEESENRTNLEFGNLIGEEPSDNNDIEKSSNDGYKIKIVLTKALSRRRRNSRGKRNYNPAAMIKGCAVPPGMETAQGYCKSIPSGITCHLYCIKGYTFPEGISRLLQCSPNKGWNKAFEECKPYADCTLKLRSGGTLDCALTTASKNAQCYVSCKRHGLYPAKPKRLYQCNSLGLWTPVLPHCVVREGIDLVEPPQVVDHEAIDYP